MKGLERDKQTKKDEHSNQTIRKAVRVVICNTPLGELLPKDSLKRSAIHIAIAAAINNTSNHTVGELEGQRTGNKKMEPYTNE